MASDLRTRPVRKDGKANRWTAEEVETLRRLYPDYDAMCEALPRHTRGSIAHKLRVAGIVAQSGLVFTPMGHVKAFTAEEKAILEAGGTIPGRRHGSYSYRARRGIRCKAPRGSILTDEEAARVLAEPGWHPERLTWKRTRDAMRDRGGSLPPIPRAPRIILPREGRISGPRIAAPMVVRPKARAIIAERYEPTPHVLASASPRGEGYDFLQHLMRTAPRGMNPEHHMELVSEVALMVLDGQASLEDLPAAWREANRRLNNLHRWRKDVSLDMPVGQWSPVALVDTLASDRGLWS